MNIVSINYSIATRSLDIFCSGCNPPYCEGCCNPELIDFNQGKHWKEYKNEIQKKCSDYSGLIDNIFLLGGSFNHQKNDEEIDSFLNFLEKNCSQKIWLFAREDKKDINPIFLDYCDYIKCGEYIPDFACDNNIQYGIKLATSNQKIFKLF